ncbi:SAM-dependent methyltransferase [Streptomyces olivoreticuli]|uniref:SAM-dependent methyltransferase n=1 Tax=Streptomyces olivoreticuli TaxID=68246 RepID=UPI000E271EA1|nr:SAM-dependent methyltransferase [Streptomyces olivoreticuli]
MTDHLTAAPPGAPALEDAPASVAGRWELPPSPSLVLEGDYVERASPARVHNFLLRGHDHSSSDREMAAVVLAADPQARVAARFTHRHRELALTYLAVERRIRQVLVVGCGYPLRPYVHTVVGRYGMARVVYADADPVALARARAVMSAAPPSHTGFVLADLAQPATLAGVQAREVLDFTRPVAVLLHHVLHLMPDPYDLVAQLKDMLASGSALSIVHATGDLHPRHVAAAEAARAAGMPMWLRSRDEVEAFCVGWRLARNGVEPTARWGRGLRADPGSGVSSAAYAVIALKP